MQIKRTSQYVHEAKDRTFWEGNKVSNQMYSQNPGPRETTQDVVPFCQSHRQHLGQQYVNEDSVGRSLPMFFLICARLCACFLPMITDN
jgi:hypothetical protein